MTTRNMSEKMRIPTAEPIWRAGSRRGAAGSGAPSMTAAMASMPGLDAGPEVPGAEVGPDDVVQDLPRAGVGQAVLEAVAHLDAHAALLPCHDEKDAVIDPFRPSFHVWKTRTA